MSGDVEKCYANALTFEEYRARLRIHVSAFNDHYERLAFVLDEEKGKTPVGNNRILILTEEYCIDSVLNIPLIARLVEVSPDAALRIARRDEHLKLAARFPGRGGTSRLPTVIFLGRSRQVLGYWSERAECAHRWVETFVAQDPMPELILEDGQPAPRLAAWMDRRFSSQRVIFEARGWRSVRDELRALANSAASGRRT